MRGNKKFDYGLVLIEGLRQSPGRFIEVRTIAEKHGLPKAYLEKIAQEFKCAGLLESRRGRGGGYRLKNPQAVSAETIFNFLLRPYDFCPLSHLKIIGSNQAVKI